MGNLPSRWKLLDYEDNASISKGNKSTLNGGSPMDMYSRRIIGWALANHRKASLTCEALKMAIAVRQPETGLLFHSDRGIEYAALDYQAVLIQYGIKPSMNRPRQCTDNAHMESFFHSLKAEDLHGRRFENDGQLRQALQSYIAFYNRQRLHSALCYLSPVAFEEHPGLQPCVN